MFPSYIAAMNLIVKWCPHCRSCDVMLLLRDDVVLQKCFTSLLNLACAIFALAALVLYAADAENASVLWMCQPGFEKRGQRPDADCETVAFLAEVNLRKGDGWGCFLS